MPGRPLCGESVTFTILPPAASPGSSPWWPPRGSSARCPPRSAPITVRKPLGVMSSAGVRYWPPALFTSRSMRPWRSSTPSTSALTCSSSRMSHTRASQRPPSARATVSSSGSSRRPHTTTCAPQAASSSADGAAEAAAAAATRSPPVRRAGRGRRAWRASARTLTRAGGGQSRGLVAAAQRHRLAERPALALVAGHRARARPRTPAAAPGCAWPARRAGRPRSRGRRSPCTRSAARRPRCPPPRARRDRRFRHRARAARPRAAPAAREPAASARPAGSSRSPRRAEHAQRGVALELVHPAVRARSTHSTTSCEEARSAARPPRSAGRRAASVVEPTTSTNSTATSRSSPPSRSSPSSAARGHLPAHVAPEQVAQPLALAPAPRPCG